MERYVSLLLRRFTVSEVRNQAMHHEVNRPGRIQLWQNR